MFVLLLTRSGPTFRNKDYEAYKGEQTKDTAGIIGSIWDF